MPDVLYDRGDKYQSPFIRFMKHQFKADKVKFINSQRNLGKWKVHKGLSKYPDISIYLPETTIYKSFNDVLYMLNKYKFIFVKASDGARGKHVLSIEQIDKKYKLTFNEHGLKESIFKDIEDVKSAFKEFSTHADKLIIACGDDLNIRSLNIEKEVIYYGFNDNNDVIAKNVNLSNTGSSFDVYMKGEFLGHFDLSIFGKHMILNTLAVISTAPPSNFL
jgi:hypothetical protein